MKHLKFEFFKQMPKTEVYRVLSNHDESVLGFVRWHGSWRQYVYDTDMNDVIWSKDCLNELKNFIVELNEKQKKVTK